MSRSERESPNDLRKTYTRGGESTGAAQIWVPVRRKENEGWGEVGGSGDGSLRECGNEVVVK